MNYAKLLNAFDDYSDRTGLPAYTQLIYYKLFALNNRVGWAEWFEATNPYVMFRADIKDEKTFIKHRNILKQHGLIDFRPGKKSQPTKYKLIKIYENPGLNPVYNPVNNPGNNPVETPGKKPDIYKQKQKLNANADNAREDDADEVLNLYQNEVGIVSPTVAELLTDAIKVNSSEWVKAAIREAVKHNARNWSYVDAILKSWRNNGFKTKPKGGSGPSRASPPMSDEEKAKKFARPDCVNCQGTGYITYFVDGQPLPKVKCECWNTPTKT
ncbi:MAG: DnaD domain-containing protein [Sporomusa sp.]